MAIAAREISALLGALHPGAGSGERLTQMFRDLDGALRGFLRRRVRSREDAEDLAQEVFLRMSRHPDLGQVECLKAFAYQTALNLVRDRSRRAYTRNLCQCVSIDDVDLPGGDDPIEMAMRDERLDQVARSLSRLPTDTRRALLLHRVDGLTYAGIAKDLGVSVSMVEKRISMALAALREVPAEGSA